MLSAVDAVHTARLKAIVAAHGWPTVAQVGQDGADAAWLLAQHADKDPAFQRYLQRSGMAAYWREHGWPDVCRANGDGVTCD